MATSQVDKIECEDFTPPNSDEESDSPENETDILPSEREMIAKGKIDTKLEGNGIRQEVIDIVYQRCRQIDINILLAGVTGSGKSSLANAIVGGSVFEECTMQTMDSCTRHVSPKTSDISGIKLRAWDCPGLNDDHHSNPKYMAEMRSVSKRFQPGDLIVFCIEAEERLQARKCSDVVKVLLYIKKKCSDKIFKTNFVIALTKVDNIMRKIRGRDTLQYYEDRIKAHEETINEILEKFIGLDRNIARGIKIFPVQHRDISDTLPDGTRWLSNFWFGCLNAIPSLIGEKKWKEYFIDIVKPVQTKIQSDLSDNLDPEKLVEEGKKYEKRAATMGAVFGVITGPAVFLIVPLAGRIGRKYGQRKYINKTKKESCQEK